MPDESRREFVKKAAYVAPAILSLQAYSSLAKAGSNEMPAAAQGPPSFAPPPKKEKKPK